MILVKRVRDDKQMFLSEEYLEEHKDEFKVVKPKSTKSKPTVAKDK